MQEQVPNDIFKVYTAKGLSGITSYASFYQTVQLTYHSCSIEGAELTLLEMAEIIADRIASSPATER
jgi:uncharacterized membrane protein